MFFLRIVFIILILWRGDHSLLIAKKNQKQMKLSECRGLNKYEILFSKTSNQVKWHEIKQNIIYFVI